MTVEVKSLKKLISESLARSEQELDLTLAGRLKSAFERHEHTKSIDPATEKPFASFYPWLMATWPAGCGLSGRKFLSMNTIINMLEEELAMTLPHFPDRQILADLVKDLNAGHGASRGKGGRPKKGEEKNCISTDAVSNGQSARHRSPNGAAALKARMNDKAATSEVKAAFQDFLDGKYRSITGAALACGLIKPTNTPLMRLKQYWKKVSKAERKAFLKWIETPDADGS